MRSRAGPSSASLSARVNGAPAWKSQISVEIDPMPVGGLALSQQEQNGGAGGTLARGGRGDPGLPIMATLRVRGEVQSGDEGVGLGHGARMKGPAEARKARAPSPGRKTGLRNPVCGVWRGSVTYPGVKPVSTGWSSTRGIGRIRVGTGTTRRVRIHCAPLAEVTSGDGAQ